MLISKSFKFILESKMISLSMNLLAINCSNLWFESVFDYNFNIIQKGKTRIYKIPTD